MGREEFCDFLIDEMTETIEREDICGHVQAVGPKLESGLKTLETLDIVGEAPGSHFMMGIEIVQDKQTRKASDSETNIGGMVALMLRNVG